MTTKGKVIAPRPSARRAAGHWGTWVRRIVVVPVVVLLVPTTAFAASSNLYPSSKKEAGAFKLAQVTGIGNREEILGLKQDHQRLLDSGIPDSALVDRSVGAGRVFCCGGLPAATGMDVLWFYIPPGDSVHVGDIVELQLGHEPSKAAPGKVNVLTQVRERASATERHCFWDPPVEGKWMRVIRCDWMEAEGWTHKKGIGNPWLKRAMRDSTR